VIGRALLVALAVTAAGCSEDLAPDECTAAADKLADCGVQGGTPAHCDTTVDRCEANCVNSHTCAEITAALTGTINGYSTCDDACH